MSTVEAPADAPRSAITVRLQKNAWGIGCLLLVAGFVAGVATAQSNSAQNTAGSELASATGRLDALDRRMKITEQSVTRLYTRVGAYESAELDLTEKGFSRVDTNNGIFYVAVEKAEPYLNGYRITVSIGNPSMATFDGAKLTLVYGDRDKPAEWKTKEEDSLAKFLAGAWTRVAITLAPATPDDLKYVSFSMKTNAISLRQAGRTY